jgi:hypothetical protein
MNLVYKKIRVHNVGLMFCSVMSAKKVMIYSQFQVNLMVIVLKKEIMKAVCYPNHVLVVTQMESFVLNVHMALLFFKFLMSLLVSVLLSLITYLVFKMKLV